MLILEKLLDSDCDSDRYRNLNHLWWLWCHPVYEIVGRRSCTLSWLYQIAVPNENIILKWSSSRAYL